MHLPTQCLVEKLNGKSGFCLQQMQEIVKKIYENIKGRSFGLEPLMMPPSPTGVLDAGIHGTCKLHKIGNNNMNSSNKGFNV